MGVLTIKLQRKPHLIAGLCLLLLLTACSEKRTLNAIPSDGVILAFGDSLTEGYGAPPGHSYPSVLTELTGMNIINAGISGEVTAEGLQRLPAALSKHQPQLVILMEGGNDILRGSDLQQTKYNLASMIELIHANGSEVVLIGVPQKKLFSNTAPLYQELADEYQLVYEGDILPELLWDNQYKSDSIHFNSAGYRQFSERIYALLKETNAL